MLCRGCNSAEPHDDGSWHVAGTLRLDEVERATGVRLPDGDEYETIGGLVMAKLGRLPVPGDTVTVPLDAEPLLDDDAPAYSAVLTVLGVQRRVPDMVRLARVSA